MHGDSFFENPMNWVALAYIVFFLLFGKKLWVVIRDMLDARTKAISTELAEAKRLREEAEALLRDASARRVAALADARALLEGAKAEAARLAAAAAEEAQASADRRERMAVDRIAAAEKAAVDEVRIAAAEVASKAAEGLIRESLTADADAALIDHAIKGLPSALGRRAA
jgi:F-type H+-transporting ATPase subunit b